MQENGVHGIIIQTADRKDIKIERYRALIMKTDNLARLSTLFSIMELFKKHIPNYTINLIDPSKLKNLENLDYDL